MTEKLYYKDRYLKEFTANIIEYKKEDNKHSVVLDRTTFFPGGGGQWCDLGYIDEIRVLNVIEDKNKIYHILESEPKRTENIKCTIDWSRRFVYYQDVFIHYLMQIHVEYILVMK
ncbi:alanine--tRNA ligase-related protein [Clostridium sp.]|uniref:alanine--tRNA ligase-related protein n=1 Tax=Clostridium sp. TaxID=1506 RepID=UPI002910046B|nr:alanine--tRNA ligase-related protein [Clostridium sp.]MDU3353281.1 alanine--tRNA ligase-related protein [Clostridium sp.]